jgi:hypothetical protein
VGPILEIKPEGNALLKQLKENASKPVKSQGNCDAMNVGIGKLKKLTKFIKNCGKEATKPLRDATSQINERISEVTAPFTEVIDKSAATVLVWDDEQERLQKEAEAKAAEEERKREEARLAEEERRKKISFKKGGNGNITPVPVPEPVTRPMPLTVTRSTQYHKHWTATVTSFAAVPDEFKILNQPKITEAMRKSKDKDGVPQAKIPGIKWECEKIRYN